MLQRLLHVVWKFLYYHLRCSWAQDKHSLFAPILYFPSLFTLKFFCLIFRHSQWRWYGLAALVWVLRTLEPSGISRPLVSAGLPQLQSVLFMFQEKKKKGRPGGSPNPLKCCFFFFFFCDRSTDWYGKPRGTNPCTCALGETVVFEAGICLLCRKKKQSKQQWNLLICLGHHCSTGFEMKMFACTLNWLPVPSPQREPEVFIVFPNSI